MLFDIRQKLKYIYINQFSYKINVHCKINNSFKFLESIINLFLEKVNGNSLITFNKLIV